MDVKTLSTLICHVSAETTLNICSHVTDTMRHQAALKIDRKIGGISAEFQQSENTPSVNPENKESPTASEFQPYKGKIRKPGTGCISNLYEGCYSPRDASGKRISKNIYTHTREECEEKLADMIVEMKKEIIG